MDGSEFEEYLKEIPRHQRAMQIANGSSMTTILCHLRRREMGIGIKTSCGSVIEINI